jgi:DNA-binding winged helix-turn-helix (wHTH) protein
VRLQFGDFVLDDEARQLLRDGAAAHLSPKAFDLLATLIRERPRALSKADLHARLWPKTFVSDASLAMLVAEVRAALGETARQPRCVRTVHRHGYAFQAGATEIPLALEVATARASITALGLWLVTSASQIPLVSGENIIGRDPRARVWLDSPGISRRHARIRVDGDFATLEDLGSKNGTHANGAPLGTAMTLEDGDQLRFGSVEVTFRTWAAESTRTAGDPS